MKNQLNKLLYLLPKGDGIRLILLIVMMFIVSVLELIGVGLVPVFIGILTDFDKMMQMEWLNQVISRSGIDTREGLFYAGIIILMVVYICKNLFISIYFYLEGKYVWNRYQYITERLFDSYMAAPYSFHLHKNSSNIIRNVTEESRHLILNYFLPGIRIIKNGLIVFLIVIFLIWVEPWLTILSVFFLGGTGALGLYKLRKRVDQEGLSAHESLLEIIKTVMESVNGLKDIQILNREKWFIHRFRKHIDRYRRSQIFWSVTSQSSSPVVETIAILSILVITFLLYLKQGNLDGIVPILALFTVATIRLLPALREIMRDVNSIQFYQFSLVPVYEDQKLLSTVQAREQRITSNENEIIKNIKFPGDITIDNLIYRYPAADEPALSNISLTIQQGSVVSFAGETGSGKTTLVDVLMGLHSPESGTIRFGEVGNRDYLKKFPNAIGYIPQFVYLTDDTIKNNIAFGLDENSIDEQKLNAAIEIAQFTNVVKNMPDGLNSKIGERGVRLSGGERQRIGIARAMYNNPKLIVMDEATSALDSQTENELMDAIERMREGRTVIIISHRISILDVCDHIWFLQNGRITADGTLKHLLQTSNDFRKMSRLTADMN